MELQIRVKGPEPRTFTSARSTSGKSTFTLDVTGEALAGMDTITLDADEEDLAVVQLNLIGEAEPFPSTVYLPEGVERAQPSVQAYRGEEHPGDDIVQRDVTVRALHDDTVVGETTVTLRG